MRAQSVPGRMREVGGEGHRILFCDSFHSLSNYPYTSSSSLLFLWGQFRPRCNEIPEET